MKDKFMGYKYVIRKNDITEVSLAFNKKYKSYAIYQHGKNDSVFVKIGDILSAKILCACLLKEIQKEVTNET